MKKGIDIAISVLAAIGGGIGIAIIMIGIIRNIGG
jgi:hypothetical protein